MKNIKWEFVYTDSLAQKEETHAVCFPSLVEAVRVYHLEGACRIVH